MRKFVFLLLVTSASFAQSPVQIPLTGTIGIRGAGAAILGGITVQIPNGQSSVTLAPDQVANHVINITSASTLTGPATVFLPITIGLDYIVNNKTTGGQFIVVGGVTGTTVSIGNGAAASIFSDGTGFLLSAISSGSNNVWSNTNTYRVNVNLASGANANPTNNFSAPHHIYSSSLCVSSGCTGGGNDNWEVGPVVANGINASSIFKFQHTAGTSGNAWVDLPAGSTTGGSPNCTTATGCGGGSPRFPQQQALSAIHPIARASPASNWIFKPY